MLQKIAGGFRSGPFLHSTEEGLRKLIHREALQRAGLPWQQTDPCEQWWSKDKAQQSRNRGVYHGLRQFSLGIVNHLIGELHETVNQPDAIRAARRFTFRYRERLYRGPRPASVPCNWPTLSRLRRSPSMQIAGRAIRRRGRNLSSGCKNNGGGKPQAWSSVAPGCALWPRPWVSRWRCGK